MKKIFIAIIMIATFQAKAQQEPHYTQNQFNSNLLLNPAYAGSDNENTNIGLRYRKQWSGFTGAPTTFSIIGDTRIKRLGIGASINHDKIGIERITTGDLNLSYHIKITENATLSAGLKAGYQTIKADFGNLVNVNTADPLYTNGGKLNYPFIGVGLLCYTPKFYIGVSMPRYGFDKPTAARRKYSETHQYAYGGLRLPLGNDIEMRPAMLLKYQAKAPMQLDIAVDTWYKNIVGFGVGYRTGDAVNFMAKANINKIYVGYSYDMNISRLRSFNRGSHEIFIGIKIPHNSKSEELDRNQNARYF